MIFAFADFIVDSDRRELRRADAVLHTEPQVFDLLVLLVENHHRVLSKDELVEKIWHGRIVSDWAVSSRIRDARKVLGDPGGGEAFIRTLRGRGIRFARPVEIRSADTGPKPAAVTATDGAGEVAPASGQPDNQPSIAVLPLVRIGDGQKFAALEEAISRELIATLASLRWMKVISHGSTFRFRGPGQQVEEIGRILGARYCLTGSVEVRDRQISVDMELSDTRNSHVIWAMRRQAKPDDIHALRAEIAANIIAATELEIPQHEANALDHLRSENFDAWSAMHVGMQHANQFSRHGNAVAGRMFELAMQKDPKLSRAYAGMAFVKFQNAFMRYSEDTAREAAQARDFAEKSLEMQPKDPFGNFMMGRIHWLDHDPESSKPWFDRSILFCPNYTWGYYGSGWADAFTGEGEAAMDKAGRAIDLSPIDPMRPGMTGIKMWVYLARQDYASAVKWAEIAARTPWAHAGMAFFAAMSNRLNGDAQAADKWMAEMRRRNPHFDLQHLMTLVPASDTYFRGLVQKAAQDLGV